MRRHHILYLLLLVTAQLAIAGNVSIDHIEPEPVIQGEKALFELSLINNSAEIYEGHLFYKAKGENDFRSEPLKRQGFNLYTEIPTKDLVAGKIEYYFAMQTHGGKVHTYPEFQPEAHPLSFELVASNIESSYQAMKEVYVLSPEPDEILPQDEVLIAISVPGNNDDIDHEKTRFLIDGINLTSRLERDENVYIIAPSAMQTGTHNAEFKIYNASGVLVGKKEWSFKVSGSTDEESEFSSRTNLYVDNRYRSNDDVSDNYIRAGLNWQGQSKTWGLRLRATTSNNDGYSDQKSTRFGAEFNYNFTPKTHLYLKGGDFSGTYSPISFWNRRIFGAAVGLVSPYFDLDVSMGTSANAVEGSTKNGQTIPGTYKESFLAVRPVFNFGKHVSWGLNLINSKEDAASIKTGSNPKEAMVVGTSLKLNFDNNRIRFVGDVQASIANKDAADEITFDSLSTLLELSDSDKDEIEPYVDFLESTGFLTISRGLAPFPKIAMQFDTYISYLNNRIHISYKNINADYNTPGNPYLQRGIKGLFISDNIRLLENQLFLNLYYKSYTDNLGQEDAEISNNDLGGSLSYFPLPSMPSFTLSYGTHSRKNSVSESDTTLFREDNKTDRITASSNYSFHTGSVKNTATLSYTKIIGEDVEPRKVDGTTTFSKASDYNVINVAVRNSYKFPLTTRIGFSQSSSLFSENTSSESENKIARYYAGVNYNIKRIANNVDFKPFVNFSLSSIDASTNSEAYNRTNISAGLIFSSFVYGNFSLRYDHIGYGEIKRTTGDVPAFNDSIINARYDVTF